MEMLALLTATMVVQTEVPAWAGPDGIPSPTVYNASEGSYRAWADDHGAIYGPPFIVVGHLPRIG